MIEAPEYLTEKIKYGEVQSYRLRSTNDFTLQRADTSAMQKSLHYRGLNMYNKMPNYLNNDGNINVFRKIVNFVKKNNSS